MDRPVGRGPSSGDFGPSLHKGTLLGARWKVAKLQWVWVQAGCRQAQAVVGLGASMVKGSHINHVHLGPHLQVDFWRNPKKIVTVGRSGT